MNFLGFHENDPRLFESDKDTMLIRPLLTDYDKKSYPEE